MTINDVMLLSIEKKGKKFVLHNRNGSYWLSRLENVGTLGLPNWRYEDTKKLHATKMKYAVRQMDLEIARVFSLTP